MERILVNEGLSVGVIIRDGRRSQSFEEALVANGIVYRSWTLPTHDPSVVALIRQSRHAADGLDAMARLTAIREACLAAVQEDDVELAGEVRAAFEIIAERVTNGVDLNQALDECRSSGTLDQPVGPGIHLLNSHKGKGQQFVRIPTKLHSCSDVVEHWS